MAKACVICAGDEASGEQLLEAPCQRHWVCPDCVTSFFERATENESLYPPKCCSQIFFLELYEGYVPFDVQWAYRMKEQGEYSVLAKYRVYCASPTCSKFLAPSTHVKNASTNVAWAKCQNDLCGMLTCTSCKTLIEDIAAHTCERDEDYKKFKQTATEKGFQECPTCASTVELAEACNHISCECGTEFCYICGKNWPGTHGCPNYGPATYDEESYNQEGYHRTTGLNREGRTRREQNRADREADGDEDEEDSDEENEDRDEEDEDEEHDGQAWNVLQHVDQDTRSTYSALPQDERELFLLNLQVQLFEERGIQFPDPDDDTNIGPGGFQGPGAADSDDSDDETDAGVVQDDSAEEGDGMVDEDTFGTGTGAIGNNENIEIADAVMTEAIQTIGNPVNDGVELTVGGANLTSGGIKESELSAEQYLSLVRTECTDHSLDQEERETATEGRGAESLQLMLLNIQLHAENGVVPWEITHGALDMLQAENPANETIQDLRLSLSRPQRNSTTQGDSGGSSSATSPDEDQPSTPIDIVRTIEQVQEERPAWKGPPEGWPDDEEL